MAKSTRRRAKRSRRQRAGAELNAAGKPQIVLNCTLGPDDKVVVNSPPPGITIAPPAAVKTLTFTSGSPVTDIKFSGPNGPVNPRYLGVGSGIIIESGATALVPKGFTAVRLLTAAQKKLNSSSPLSGEVKIRNLETASLGLSATNRNFTVTLTTV